MIGGFVATAHLGTSDTPHPRSLVQGDTSPYHGHPVSAVGREVHVILSRQLIQKRKIFSLNHNLNLKLLVGNHTPQKTNMEPLEEEIPNLEIIIFRFHVKFRGWVIPVMGGRWVRESQGIRHKRGL